MTYAYLKAFALLTLAPILLSAQSTFGTILGTVIDKTGSVVPKVKMVVTNRGENHSRTLFTDNQGNFEALNLKAGHYTVTAEAAGFRIFRADDLELDARQTMRLNIALELGQVAEAVTVGAAAPVISTDTGAIAATFGSQEVLHLPVNYRGAGSTSPLSILAFQPGVQRDDSSPSSNAASVQGALPAQTEITLDGISTVNVTNNSPLADMFPSAENIAEMKVQGAGSNAEFGQIGDITTTSKGGTNEFHGSAFEYIQNRAFDASAFGAASKPQKTANDFGGSLGGRILRNRTFFFADFENMRYRTANALQATVPTQAMRDGDLSR